MSLRDALKSFAATSPYIPPLPQVPATVAAGNRIMVIGGRTLRPARGLGRDKRKNSHASRKKKPARPARPPPSALVHLGHRATALSVSNTLLNACLDRSSMQDAAKSTACSPPRGFILQAEWALHRTDRRLPQVTPVNLAIPGVKPTGISAFSILQQVRIGSSTSR